MELKTRGHRFKVRRERFKRDLSGNFFTQRVVRIWNELPEKVVEAGPKASFKKHLDKYIDGKGLEGYGPNVGNLDQLGGHHGQHGSVGPKGLFPCCIAL